MKELEERKKSEIKLNKTLIRLDGMVKKAQEEQDHNNQKIFFFLLGVFTAFTYINFFYFIKIIYY